MCLTGLPRLSLRFLLCGMTAPSRPRPRNFRLTVKGPWLSGRRRPLAGLRLEAVGTLQDLIDPFALRIHRRIAQLVLDAGSPGEPASSVPPCLAGDRACPRPARGDR